MFCWPSSWNRPWRQPEGQYMDLLDSRWNVLVHSPVRYGKFFLKQLKVISILLNSCFGLASFQIPELNELGDEIERDFHANANLNKTNDEERTLSNPSTSKPQEPFDLGLKLKILVIQNIGIITGFSFMLIMAIYSGEISLE